MRQEVSGLYLSTSDIEQSGSALLPGVFCSQYHLAKAEARLTVHAPDLANLGAFRPLASLRS